MIAIICGLSILAEYAGLFWSWNQSLGDLRMSLWQKESNGEIVFIAVDSRSLSEVGSWPWSREVHANLLKTVTNAGVVDVLFDFDFAFPGDTEGDQAFAEALQSVGGTTYLAVFEQIGSAVDLSSRHFNLPLPIFAAHSWRALVNVGADAQGLVRHYPFGAQFGGEYLPSAGSLIANNFQSSSDTFDINFSIRADSIPVISAIDLLRGSVPPEFVSGRSVILGASAIELSDQIAVPVQGILPGPLLHALAAETLWRGLEIKWLRSDWVLLGLTLVLFSLQGLARKRPLLFLSGSVGILFSVEIGGMLAFRTASIMVPSAVLYPGLIGFAILTIARSLQTRTWLLQKTSSEARNTLRLLERVFDDGSDGIVILGKDGSILRHSASAAEMFGTDAEGNLDLPERLYRANPFEKNAPPRFIEVHKEYGVKVLEYRATSSIVELPKSVGKPTQQDEITTIVLRDITQLKEQEQDIAYLSNYDDRTGALRRNAFLAFLKLRLEAGEDAIVFALKLDRFKTVNVTLGRDVGDAILKELVARIERSSLQLSAPVRFGGTGFAFYTESRADVLKADRIARNVAQDIGRLYRLKDVNAQVGVCIGYALVEDGSGVPAETALGQAVEAMETAKESGLEVAAYDHSAWEKQRRAREIERAMEYALQSGEFQILYQPQHRVADRALIGAEALIRWHSPTLGHVSPDEFICIAESTGFIVELGKWTLENAAKDALTLPEDVTIAVNVSGIQIMRSDLVKDVASILKKTGLPPSRICLELTETVLLEASNSIIETMQDLRFLGVTWALDDFGTGFSSMEYLSRMPLDKVKLDKSFTMRLGDDPTARPILHSTSELCRGLDVKLLCEGVETDSQLTVLAEEGCAEAQGFYFGRPAPIDQLLQIVERSAQST
jgi:diguanylate cyclase (GGDEF)-like protein